jgi:peptidoglycan/LPS O-acetylase OafA/YrhL
MALSRSTPDLFYHLFIVIRVAWTIAIELGFYLIAPFVVRRIPVIAGLMTASLLAQLLWHKFRRSTRADTPASSALALAWFMAGALAYHGYVWLRLHCVKRYAMAATLTAALATVAYPWLPWPARSICSSSQRAAVLLVKDQCDQKVGDDIKNPERRRPD